MTDTDAFPPDFVDPLHSYAAYDRYLGTDELQRVHTVHGTEAWVIAGYRDVSQVLRNPDISSDAHRPGYPVMAPSRAFRSNHPLPVNNMDPPQHGKYRRLGAVEFSLERVTLTRPWIESTISELLDEIEAQPGPVDLVAAYCAELPARVICRMLGFPVESRRRYMHLDDLLLRDDTPDKERAAAYDEMTALMDAHVDARDANRGDEFIDRLLEEHDRGEITRDEVTRLSQFFYSSALPNTANAIARSVAALLQHRAQIDVLLDPDTDLEAAVHELLRWTSTVPALARVATKTISVRGQEIPEGDGILVALPAANHDPTVFDDPHVLDLRRRHHRSMAFGHGIHMCPGQHLVRAEMTVGLHRLFARFPTLRLDGEVTFKVLNARTAIETLPVTWDRSSSSSTS